MYRQTFVRLQASCQSPLAIERISTLRRTPNQCLVRRLPEARNDIVAHSSLVLLLLIGEVLLYK